MAERGVSNERKKELEQLDPFQENLLKAVAAAKKYKKPLLLGLAALVIAVGAFWAALASFHNAQENAANLLAKAGTVYAGTKDAKAGYDAVKEDFQHIFEEYANTPAGKMARIRFAGIACSAGHYNTAYEMYAAAYEDYKDDPLLKEMLLLSLGNVCVARKDYEKAMDFFDDARGYKGGIWKEQALFMAAQLHDLKNDTASSRKIYQEFPSGKSSEQPSSIYQEMAKDRVNQMP